ncbi:unnamed protein product, partial [Scytosiphon promiscuus]
ILLAGRLEGGREEKSHRDAGRAELRGPLHSRAGFSSRPGGSQGSRALVQDIQPQEVPDSLALSLSPVLRRVDKGRLVGSKRRANVVAPSDPGEHTARGVAFITEFRAPGKRQTDGAYQRGSFSEGSKGLRGSQGEKKLSVPQKGKPWHPRQCIKIPVTRATEP